MKPRNLYPISKMYARFTGGAQLMILILNTVAWTAIFLSFHCPLKCYTSFYPSCHRLILLLLVKPVELSQLQLRHLLTQRPFAVDVGAARTS